MEFSTAPAPHDVVRNSVGRVMRLVMYALLPTIVAHVVFFGWGLIIHIALASAAALGAEAFALRLRGRPIAPSLADGSALVTAVLLSLCLPPLAPWWLVMTGAAFAIFVAKHLFGGLGYNPFNPAMVGFAVMLISFPVQMNQWLPPAVAGVSHESLSFADTLSVIFTGNLPLKNTWDVLTGATALSSVRTGLALGKTMEEIFSSPLLSEYGGRGFSVVSLAAMLGGIALLALGVIRWHIPVAMLLAVVLAGFTMHSVDPGAYPGVMFHLFSGATMLGAFFIATDPVTAATSPVGKLIYGAGIGLLTYVIRTWGGYPDGVAFAVLMLNVARPLIDRYTIPRIYGHNERTRL